MRNAVILLKNGESCEESVVKARGVLIESIAGTNFTLNKLIALYDKHQGFLKEEEPDNCRI